MFIPPMIPATVRTEFLFFPTGVLRHFFATVPAYVLFVFLHIRFCWHSFFNFMSAAVRLDGIYGNVHHTFSESHS